jgi:4-aminobutyrate aminotransferase-like enzyme
MQATLLYSYFFLLFQGLMIGVELVSDRQTRTPMAAPHFADIWEHCKDMGVLFGKGGLTGNVSFFNQKTFV